MEWAEVIGTRVEETVGTHETGTRSGQGYRNTERNERGETGAEQMS